MYTFIGIAALVVIAVGIIISNKLKATLSSRGISIETKKKEPTEKDRTSVKNVRSKSDVDLESPKNRNIQVEDIEQSNIKIKK
jgi:hypothetical protein